MFDIKKLAFKNSVLNLKKCHPNILQKISFLFL